MPNSKEFHARCALGRRNLTRAVGVALGTLMAISLAGKPAAARRGGGGHRGRCFLRGTRIRTCSGYRKIESLAVGDLVPAHFAGMSPIKRIGHYHWRRADPREPWANAVKPVRIERSALDDNVPGADLYVTPSHALFIDGMLVRAGSLVNGITITTDDANDRDELEYFHIELESHDVIEAEGAPCETLQGDREIEVWSGGVVRRHQAPQMPCAPILSFNGGRSEVRSRLRSAASPFVDRRLPLDVIRDRLEDRALALGGSASSRTGVAA